MTYVIKLIVLKDNKEYLSSKIVDNTNKKISVALILLENAARNFVKEEFGVKAYELSKILDIHKIDQVNEPIVDSMLLYRINDDPHRINVYQKRTEVIDQNGWFSTTKVPQSYFKRTHIFELEEYNGFCVNDADTNVSPIVPQIKMIPVGPAKIKIPEPMTVSPICNMIEELKKSPKFKSLFVSANLPIQVVTDL